MSANRLEGTAARSFKIWLEMDQMFEANDSFARGFYPNHSEFTYSRDGFYNKLDHENWYPLYLNEPEHFLAGPKGLGISRSAQGILIGEETWRIGKAHPMRTIKGSIAIIAEDPYGVYSRMSRAIGSGKKAILAYTPNEAVYGTFGVETIYDKYSREISRHIKSGSPTFMEEYASVQQQDYDPNAGLYYEPLSSSITGTAKSYDGLRSGAEDYYYDASPNQNDTSNREFYVDVFVKNFSKSEIDSKLGILTCSIEFDCLSPWYRLFGVGDSHPVDRSADEQSRMLEDYGYTKRIACYGARDYNHPCRIVLAPPATSTKPYWIWNTQASSGRYESTLEGKLAVPTTFNPGEGILIDTIKHPGELWKVATTDNWETYTETEWLLPKSDFATRRFITLANGINNISCTDEDNIGLEYGVPVFEMKEYYESV